MKRSGMLELLRAVRDAQPPEFREVLRTIPHANNPGQMIAVLFVEASASASLSYGQQPEVAVSFFVKNNSGEFAKAHDMRADELRRVAEIREAVYKWRDGEGEWPTPKAGA